MSREIGRFVLIRAVTGERYVWARHWMLRVWPPKLRRVVNGPQTGQEAVMGYEQGKGKGQPRRWEGTVGE